MKATYYTLTNFCTDCFSLGLMNSVGNFVLGYFLYGDGVLAHYYGFILCMNKVFKVRCSSLLSNSLIW